MLQNEEILKKATTDYQEKLKRSEEKYRLLKKHAEEKIERFVVVVLSGQFNVIMAIAVMAAVVMTIIIMM